MATSVHIRFPAAAPSGQRAGLCGPGRELERGPGGLHARVSADGPNPGRRVRCGHTGNI